MRWAYLGLICLGLVAAAAAAVLVAGLQGKKTKPTRVEQEQAPMTTVVTAADDLEAMKVVDGNAVALKEIRADARPEEAMSAPEQVIGKVLAIRMKEGQAFTNKCFVTEGSGPQMAAVLSRGKRAVSVSLPSHSALHGLLYPGCLVDVLLSTELQQETRRQDRYVSVPLLQRIQVLAVGGETVFTAGQAGEERDGSTGRGRLLITLMVDPDQARALQLGQERGTLSLAMRNPFDQDEVSQSPLQIHDVVGGLPALASTQRTSATRMVTMPRGSATEEEPDESEAVQEDMDEEPPKWEVTVIRGGRSEKEEFEQPELKK